MRLTRLLKSRGHCNALKALQCPEISAGFRRLFFICLGALLVDLVIHKQADIQEIIDDTLKHLGERTETIFRLSRFEGLTNREIAPELGISEKTVEYHMSKALKELRVSLEDYLPMLLFFNLYHLVG